MSVKARYLFLLISFALLTACATANKPVGVGSNVNDAVLDRARAHTNLGAAYLQQNKLEIALDEFSQAIQILPTYAMAYNGLAMVRSVLKQDKEAEFNFKKSIDLDPSVSESRNNYGIFLCDRGRYKESIQQFLAAVENPLYSTPNLAYANAGICAARGNDTQSAEIYLNKALQIQPLTHSAAHKLAEIQFNRGDVVPAKKTLQNALVAAPNPDVLWLGIKIAQSLGNRNDEASYALELRRRFPNANETKLLLNQN